MGGSLRWEASYPFFCGEQDSLPRPSLIAAYFRYRWLKPSSSDISLSGISQSSTAEGKYKPTANASSGKASQ